MGITFNHDQPHEVEQSLRGAVIETLAAYALMCFYGEDGTYYGTAWRLYRTKIMLIMARDQI